MLRALGAVIRSSIRTVDSAYRYGGDEFVVLLPETDIVGAFVVAEKIRGGAEEVGQSLIETEPLTSVSIGLVSHPEDGLSAEELMTAADRAMYQAKKLGKNQISGNPRPRPALLARRSTRGRADARGSRNRRVAAAGRSSADAGDQHAGVEEPSRRGDRSRAPRSRRAPVAVELGAGRVVDDAVGLDHADGGGGRRRSAGGAAPHRDRRAARSTPTTRSGARWTRSCRRSAPSGSGTTPDH